MLTNDFTKRAWALESGALAVSKEASLHGVALLSVMPGMPGKF